MASDPSSSEELVLSFLAEAGDEFVSGEAISDKLGLTRAAVWKHVEALRAHGYRIDAVPARGYRLAGIPDRLTALELRPLLNTHDLGQVLHTYEELGSTSDRAKELADEGAAHGEVVVAETQTAGRGRRGRTWISPPRRNLYFSVVLRPDLPPARAAELTLVASLAICDALRQAGVDAGIKWPNDVLVGGKKIAGILTELAAEPDRVHWVVVGVGVNVNARVEDFPAELREEATSVAIERHEPAPRALFAAACLTALEGWIDVHAEQGFAPIRNAWRERSVTLGRQVLVRSDGREIAGVAEDIDEQGALLVRTPERVERILAGDVHLLRPR
ncbi:biotin--[acetyl-CoA-carboxylase] ligase [Anaeromyxobacter oryzae]|uniref:Bifunctional ligase/repressor BirA n=1 Tax=Anaeromyxobacter oryzae TaxID=2918170 RepID=A0ABM7WQ81_9BACT|nr:biotin--[acetyl-CoA-carboxylase] ligase [Anaeromyxobacter oryzae]BDG01621.1 bifunctional ligase/repressor BirA [Anaeromyxobacter oryzae]